MPLVDEEKGVLLRLDARTDAGIDLQFFKGKHGLELLSSRGKGVQQRVRVFASDRTLDRFTAAIERYGLFEPLEDARKPNYFEFFERVADAKPSSVDKLWISADGSKPPIQGIFDWEVWLRPSALSSVLLVASRFSITVGGEPLRFPMAAIVVMTGTYGDLRNLLQATSAAIEIRPASSLAALPMDATRFERREILTALAARIEPAQADAPRTAIIDTGVRYNHALLSGSLPVHRATSVATGIVPEDIHGHGTQMAGVALYGDLNRWRASSNKIVLTTALESVAIFDGSMTPFKSISEAVMAAYSRLERDDARRVYSLSFWAPQDPSDGRPSALSSLVDKLAFARDGVQRLFCVAAGNTDHSPIEIAGYIGVNDHSGIRTPGQAVNALTVGAYTVLRHYGTITGHAPSGDLSPTSRTAIGWRHHLACKPDVVMEGGNMIAGTDGLTLTTSEALSVLTTHNEIPNRPFAAGTETSIATATAAGLATRLMAAYPELWPEAVRGLVVHSARWTDAMKGRRNSTAKRGALSIIRRFGWGVPNEERAFTSAGNRLTMIIQDDLRHLKPSRSGVQYDNMRYYRLPWPSEALDALGTAVVSLRVTLSYFAEPHPHAVNYERIRDYLSHGFNFDLKHPDDSDDQAIARVNKKAREAMPKLPTRRLVGSWLLGKKHRSPGTLHQDVWTGPASDLAAMGAISVQPQYGWWHDFDTDVEPLQSVRFVLIASIETARTTVDFATETEVSLEAIPTRTEVAITTSV